MFIFYRSKGIFSLFTRRHVNVNQNAIDHRYTYIKCPEKHLCWPHIFLNVLWPEHTSLYRKLGIKSLYWKSSSHVIVIKYFCVPAGSRYDVSAMRFIVFHSSSPGKLFTSETKSRHVFVRFGTSRDEADNAHSSPERQQLGGPRPSHAFTTLNRYPACFLRQMI